MSPLAEVEALLPEMTPGEKAALLQLVARDLGQSFPGIDRDSAVCGGEACVSRTRIPVWTLVHFRQRGLGDADVLRSYPTLRAEDVAHAWSYYNGHREEIDRAIAENEAD